MASEPGVEIAGHSDSEGGSGGGNVRAGVCVLVKHVADNVWG